MGDTTGINWADSTFNPWIGCTKISPACDHCYAERDTKRFGRVEWGAGKPRVRTSAGNWNRVLRWNRHDFYQCACCGWRGDKRNSVDGYATCPGCDEMSFVSARRRVFCASLADWLDNEVPIEWLVDLLDLIRLTPNLDWLLLSKRIGNWLKRLDAAYCHLRPDRSQPESELATWIGNWLCGVPPKNVWLGITVINQLEADRDIPKLLNIPAWVRFLSIEPMLGPIDLSRVQHLMSLSWVICGGESGPEARPMSISWARSLRDQCLQAGIPFLFKQWGSWSPPPPDYASEQMESDEIPGKFDGVMVRVGKKAAGRTLDGVLHDGFPLVGRRG